MPMNLILLERVPKHQSESAAHGVKVAGHRLRLPTSRDLAAVVVERDEQNAARRLLKQLCVDSMPAEWSDELETQISRALDEADPCMDLALDLVCPACEHAWRAPFDVGAFLWEEVDVRGRRLLDEVHAIARSYSWSERQILELSETRRHAYLERVLA